MRRSVAAILSVALGLGIFAGCGSSGNDSDDGSVNVNLEWCGDESYVSPKNVSAADAENQSSGLEENWWKDTSFYHIWVKSFCDSDGDGCGDFKGIENKLSYIKDDLGCDGIWLSPIFECDYKGKSASVNMHGYDVKDYYAVNSYFGTEDELISLINACHTAGIKIIFDFVPNHSGSGNQWFVDSCKNANGKKDWYLWNDEQPSWNTGMSLTGWNYDSTRGEYYYHAFADSQPDLNYYNYEVREEMKNVVRYWLNKGFDGLRIDAVRYLVETNDSQVDTQGSHDWFAELRTEIDKYASPKFMTCEAWITGNRTLLESYFGTSEKPEFNMVLDFDQGLGAYNLLCNPKTTKISSGMYANISAAKTYGTFIGNHDEYLGRIGSRFGGYDAEIRNITGMSLLRPTVPFIYYGNEIGMKENTSFGTGDIRLRTALNWTDIETQKADSSSILNFNKALLSLRKSYPSIFNTGKITQLTYSTYLDDKLRTDGSQAYVLSDSTGDNNLLCVYLPIYNCDETNSWFVKDACLPASAEEFTLVIGNAPTSDSKIEYDDGFLLVTNMAPYETRVYYFGTGTAPSRLYSENRMFLRGSMNNWGYQEMTYDSEKKLWSTNCTLSAGTDYQFKFDTDACWTLAYGSGNSTDKTVSLDTETLTSTEEGADETNFTITVSSSGTYNFTFYEATKTFVVSK